MGETLFSYRDLYPNMGMEETSLKSNPESDDLDALNEDAKLSEESSISNAKSKNILIAIGVLVALVFFFGGAK